MPRVLICASTARHINNFHLPYLKFFKDRGFEVHVAVPDKQMIEHADILHSVPITKSFASPENIKAVKMLRQIIKSNSFELIITHTALASAVCRLALMLSGKVKRKTKLINTVHGYLFWNGCSLKKRLVYYTPELLLKSVTDMVITMNDEDTITAQRLVKKGGQVIQVPGMGADETRFKPVSDLERQAARSKLSIPEDAFVLVYAAEFSKRKNHHELILAMRNIVSEHPQAILLLCGTGALEEDIKAEASEMGLSANIRFLGWCGCMEEIYKACDLAVSTSKSEGMPFNIIEAQLCALPVAASRIRGHIDLIEQSVNGWCYPPGDYNALAGIVIDIIKSPDRGKAQGIAASRSAGRFTLKPAFRANTDAYVSVLNK